MADAIRFECDDQVTVSVPRTTVEKYAGADGPLRLLIGADDGKRFKKTDTVTLPGMPAWVLGSLLEILQADQEKGPEKGSEHAILPWGNLLRLRKFWALAAYFGLEERFRAVGALLESLDRASLCFWWGGGARLTITLHLHEPKGKEELFLPLEVTDQVSSVLRHSLPDWTSGGSFYCGNRYEAFYRENLTKKGAEAYFFRFLYLFHQATGCEPTEDQIERCGRGFSKPKPKPKRKLASTEPSHKRIRRYKG